MAGYAVKILVVEDSAIIGSRIMELLSTLSSVTLLGQAKSIRAARKMCAETEPDIILLDSKLPDGQGLTILSEFKDQNPVARIIILSNTNDLFFRRKCYETGAAYVMDKNSELPGITEVIEALLKSPDEASFLSK